jgi:neutral ceramidase
MVLPYQWQPQIVSTHFALVGNVAIAGVPGEFTTMSGRRLRNTVKNAIAGVDKSIGDINVIVAGLCNTYSDYIATPEEYQVFSLRF